MAEQDPNYTVACFLKFVMNAQDPNYSFMCDFTFEILDSVFLYRAGVCCSIPDFAEAGRAKYAKVWSGRHHPHYRELEMADTIQMTRMPLEVEEFVQETSSINLTGKPNTGEGADFRLEEVNPQIQQWLPNIPNFMLQLCKVIRTPTELCTQMEVEDPKLGGKRYIQDIDDDIISFRTKLS